MREKERQLWGDTFYNYSGYIKKRGIKYEDWNDEDEQGGAGDLKRVISLIRSYKEKEGVVIGILGDWGTGKTSILRGVESYFKELKYPVLFFEAWKYHTEDNPIIPLLQKLIEIIPDKREVKRILNKAIWVGADILLQVLSKGRVNISDIRKRYQEDTLKRVSFYDELSKEMKKTIGSLTKGNKKFILIVDDLDRCLPDKAVRLLEGLRFYFQVENTVIILGLNEEILAKYLEDVYKPTFEKGQGYHFLRKIFDWHIELSRKEPEKVIDYFFKDEDKKIKDIFSVLDPLSYRIWKKVANRYFSLLEENRIYAAFEAIIKECFSEMALHLRKYPTIRDIIIEDFPNKLKLNDGDLRKTSEELYNFVKLSSEKSIWDEEGEAVMNRLRREL